MFIFLFFIAISGLFSEFQIADLNQKSVTSLTPVEWSVELVEALREGKSTEKYTSALAAIPEDSLHQALNTEPKKKAFWINIYNAYVQILLIEDPTLFEDRNSWFGYNFFTTPQVEIAGKMLSFDDIEHGIMRRSKFKLSLGYISNPFPDPVIERFWWDKIDPRIHFALNCGAASCPAIAVYRPERVNEQLDITTKQYLEQTTIYHEAKGVAEVNRLMSWFRADFGGKEGAKEMLRKYDIVPEDAQFELSFKEYDWTLDLNNYKSI